MIITILENLAELSTKRMLKLATATEFARPLAFFDLVECGPSTRIVPEAMPSFLSHAIIYLTTPKCITETFAAEAPLIVGPSCAGRAALEGSHSRSVASRTDDLDSLFGHAVAHCLLELALGIIVWRPTPPRILAPSLVDDAYA